MTVEAVVFDIGNVLIEWNPERFYDQQIGAARRQELFATVDLHRMNAQVDAGALFRETVYACAAANPEWETEIRWWYDRWIDLASPRIDGSIALLRALRAKGIPVFALSNFGIDSFAYAQTQYSFLTEFDQLFVSGHLGVIKPASAIYEHVERGSGVPPESLLFTDDLPENIAAAAERGWKTHLFTGWKAWAQRLVEEDLLTRQEAGL